MGALSTALLCAALAQAGSISIPGTPASAWTTTSRAFAAVGRDASVEQFEDARGQAELTARDRIDVPQATYGDRGSFNAEVRLGLVDYRIELVTVGAPPYHRDENGRLVQTGSRNIFPFPTGGGVELGNVLFGRTGVGLLPLAPAQAGISLFGTARVIRDGIVVDEESPIEVIALATGVHADDETHRRLPAGREGDTELIVYLPQVASDLVPNHFLLFVFEDVAIEVAGQRLPQVATVPTEVVPPPGVLPRIAALQNIPPLSGPNFQGFATSPATQDNVPIGPSPTPSTPEPLNATPALPLPQGESLPNTATAQVQGMGVSSPPPTLPVGITPLNASPATNPTAPSVQPGNATAALPLPPTVQPLNSQPALTGPGTATSSTAVGGAGAAGTVAPPGTAP